MRWDLLAVGVGALLAMALTPDGANAGDATVSSTPDQYLASSRKNAESRLKSKYTGEGWAWHARYPMQGFLDSYLATKDPAWLDAAVKYFDWTLGLLLPGPDGYSGWIGISEKDEKLSEHPISDAILLEPMVTFATIVLKDEPALADKYGEKARAYVGHAKKIMFEKWEKRGTWHEDGPFGVFTEWPKFFTEKDASKWQDPPPGVRTITLPFNMLVHWGITAARIHRVTGEDAWREKACKLFNFLKSRLCLVQDHYTWNYWEPFGPWDVDPAKPKEFRHWVGVHPYRDYQAGEIAEIVEAFHYGIAFDAEDMKRFVNTNVKVMWNGNLDDTKWNNSNAGAQKAALGQIRLASKPTGIFNRYAGCLWSPLAGFDATVRKLYEKELKAGSFQHAYYFNVTQKKEPSYERRHPELPPKVLDWPFNSCSTLTMAAAMPSTIAKGETSLVSCLCRDKGELGIALHSADGKDKVATIREPAEHPAGFLNLKWDPKDIKPGAYRVRWTLKGEYRDFPITVK